MPGFIIGAVVTAALTEAAIVGVLAAKIIGSAVGFIVSGIINRPDKPEQQRAPVVRAQGRLVTVRQPISPWQIIYGQARVGGVLTFVEQSANKIHLHLVITLAGHEVEEIGDIYFNDERVPLDANGNATGRFVNFVRIKKSLGNEPALGGSPTTDGQPFPDLVAESAGKWTNAHRQTGRAKIYVRLRANHTFFPAGVPNITAVVKGRKVIDPRVSPTASAHSSNVALCVNDYFTNSSFGMAEDTAQMDASTLTAAANVCDEQVERLGSPTTYENRYACNGSFHLDETPQSILQRLLASMAGWAVRVGGKWYIYAGAYEAPTVDLDEGDLAGPIRVQPMFSRSHNANGVKGIFVDPNQAWQPVEFPPITGAAYLAQDNNERVWRDVDLTGFTTSGSMAQRLAKIELLRARQGLSVSAPFKLSAYRAVAGRTVSLTNQKFGWTAKAFDVVGVSFTMADELGVRLDLRETAAAVYDWSTSDEQSVDLAPNTDLPDPLDLEVTGLSLSSGTADLFVNGDGTVVPRIRARWTPTTSSFLAYHQIQFARSSGSPQDWVDAPSVVEPLDEGFAHPVKDGETYDVRVRAVGVFNNVGEWAQVNGHTVVGKTAPPSNVTGFTAQQNEENVNFRWDQVSDADLAGYEIRYNDEGVTDWESAAVVTSVTRGTAITNGFVPPGSWELLIKARDTSGNYSTSATAFSLTVVNTSTQVEGVEEAPQWAGLKTNMVRHWTGVLVPDSTSTAASLGTDLFDECVPDPYPTCSYQVAVEMDLGFEDTVRAWGDIQALVAPGSTEPSDPEFLLDYRLESGSYDGLEVWTIGTATARYFLAGFQFDTADGILIFTGFAPVIDKNETDRHDEGVVVAAGGTQITFSPPFHATPNLQVTAQGGGSPVEARFSFYENLSTTGAKIHVTNAAGTSIGGTANWSATGT